MSRPVVSILDGKNASSFKSIDDIVLIAHLAPGDRKLEDRLRQVAKQYHDRYSFALRHRTAHGVALDCINNVNFEQFSISDLSDPLAIDHLIRQCTMPLIPAFTRRNEGELAQVRQILPSPPSLSLSPPVQHTLVGFNVAGWR